MASAERSGRTAHRKGIRPFCKSHIVQMLAALERKGLVFKDRRARYASAVPLFGQFIRRELASAAA